MKELFDFCVELLNKIATVTGLTYEEANIWIFVIIHPAITMLLLISAIYLLYQKRKKTIKASSDKKILIRHKLRKCGMREYAHNSKIKRKFF